MTLAAVNIGQSFQNAMDVVGRTVPKMLVFALIIVVGWIVAKVIHRVVNLVLDRVGFDRVLQKGMVGEALKRSDYDASDLIAKLCYYAVLLIALQLAFGVFGPNPISTLLTGVVAWLPKAVVGIVLIVIASAIAHAVKDMVGAALSSRSYGGLLANVASIFIVALGVIAALNQVGVATTVTEPVLITVLATVGAVIAIGVGGGMVRPMQDRWERWLSGAEQEVSGGRGGAYNRGREDAERGSAVPTEAAERRESTH